MLFRSGDSLALVRVKLSRRSIVSNPDEKRLCERNEAKNNETQNATETEVGTIAKCLLNTMNIIWELFALHSF
jgi:hypothetical protein